MPPAKDVKKSAAKSKKITGGPKVINQADYQREKSDMHVPDDFISPKPAFGKILNVEEIFPDWNTSSEIWNESVYDNITEPVYPAHFSVKSLRNLKSIFGLQSEDDEKGSKSRKTGKSGDGHLEECDLDDKGHILPKMVIEKEFKLPDDHSEPETLIEPSIIRPFAANQQDPEILNAFAMNPDALLESEEEVDYFYYKSHCPYNCCFLQYLPDFERDPLVCAAFKLVGIFGPNILHSNSGKDSFPLLWKAIYPQNHNGRPVYNPAGKYCVRLYLAGKWRKVTVSDIIPLTADDRPALASSSEHRELWPTILAKAVYTVYTKCGYHKIIPTVGAEKVGPEDARISAAFVCFVVHLLTGWLPGSTWSLPEVSAEDPERLDALVQEMIYGGMVQVSAANIPDAKPLLKETNEETAARERKFTMKQIKAEARRKRADKSNLLKAITLREHQIERLDNMLKKPFSEWYFVTIPSTQGGVRVLPVLAMSYSDAKDFESAQLLVEWAINTPIPQPPPGDYSIDMALPPTTPIASSWMTVSELCSLGALVQGVDTKINAQNCADLSWHWTAIDEKKTSQQQQVAQTSKKEKEKEATKEKPTPSPAASRGRDHSGSEFVYERPAFYPMLLKIETADFLAGLHVSTTSTRSQYQRSRRASSIQNDRFSLREDLLNATNQPLVPTITADDNQSVMSAIDNDDDTSLSTARSALNLNRDSGLCRYFDTRSLKKKRNYLTVTLFLHEDLIHTHSTGQENLLSPSSVLVLQEIHSDYEEPLVMRLQLSSDSPIPLRRVTFHIPSDRVTPQPMLFWCRLFSTSSLYFQIYSSAQVLLRPAEEVWQSIGGQVLSFTGDVPITPMGMERMFFRKEIQLFADKALKAPDENDMEEEEFASTATNEELVICFMSIVHRDVTPYVSLLIHDDTSKNSMPLPRLEGNVISASNGMKTLIGRCFNPMTHLPAFTWKFLLLHKLPLTQTVPPYVTCLQRYQGIYRPNNKHIVFRDVLRFEPGSFPVGLRISAASIQGLQQPLNIDENICFTVKLFRKADRKQVSVYHARGMVQIYKITDTPFLADPIIEEEKNSSGQSRKPSSTSTKGSTAAKGSAKPSVTPKKEDKQKKDPEVTEVDILIECSLDAAAMTIPATWSSRLPFEFSTMKSLLGDESNVSADVEGNEVTKALLDNKPSADAQFEWRMDLLAGQIIGVSHDTYDLERYTAMKNAWEAAREGREAQATAAVQYVLERRRMESEANNSGVASPDAGRRSPDPAFTLPDGSPTRQRATSPPDPTSKVKSKQLRKSPSFTKKNAGAVPVAESAANPEAAILALSSALKIDVEVVRKREELANSLPKYNEYIEVLPIGGTTIFVTDEEVLRAKTARHDDVNRSIASAAAEVQKLAKLTELHRKLSLEHINALVVQAATNMDGSKRAWLEREKYRVFADAKNSAYKYLQERSLQAMEAIASDDWDGKDKKGKLKAKDVKKKK